MCKVLSVLILFLAVGAFGQTATPTATATKTPTVTNTPTITNTPTPTVTPFVTVLPAVKSEDGRHKMFRVVWGAASNGACSKTFGIGLVKILAIEKKSVSGEPTPGPSCKYVAVDDAGNNLINGGGSPGTPGLYAVHLASAEATPLFQGEMWVSSPIVYSTTNAGSGAHGEFDIIAEQ